MDNLGPGTVVVARYRLDEPAVSDLLGVEAWDATDQILDRPVRVSVLTGPDAALTLDAARRAALVSDPHVSRVLDVLHDASHSLVVTEPAVGSTLFDLVETGPLSPHAARAIIGDAATALEAARRRGVHHGALRPSAIRIHRGTVRVTGLGIDGDLVRPETAPDGDALSRQDTVALVALLHYALTGVLPRAGYSAAALDPSHPAPYGLQVDGEILSPPRDLEPGVPQDLDTLCAVTLGQHEDGPATPGALVSELAPWDDSAVPVTGELPVAAPESTPSPPGGVTRQSVRTYGSSASPSPGASMPGTPPPAGPVRRSSTGRIPRVHGHGADGSVGAVGGAVVGAAAGGAAAASAGGQSRPVTTAGATAATGLPVGASPVGTVSLPAGAPPAAPAPAPRSSAPGSSRPSPTKGGRRMRVNPTPLVLILMIGLVGTAGYMAWSTFVSPYRPAIIQPDASRPPVDGGASEDPEAPPAEPTPDVKPPPIIASGTEITAPGDKDHPERADLAIDNDPATAWYSLEYKTASFGGLPRQLGYAITLQEPTEVSTVYLETGNVGGGWVEIRATDAAHPTDGEVLAAGEINGPTTFQFDKPVDTQNLVLWFTSVPQATDGKFRVHIFEIALS